MLQILNWDFRYNKNMAKGAKLSMDVFNNGVPHDIASPKRSDCILVQVTNLSSNFFWFSAKDFSGI